MGFTQISKHGLSSGHLHIALTITLQIVVPFEGTFDVWDRLRNKSEDKVMTLSGKYPNAVESGDVTLEHCPVSAVLLSQEPPEGIQTGRCRDVSTVWPTWSLCHLALCFQHGLKDLASRHTLFGKWLPDFPISKCILVRLLVHLLDKCTISLGF